MDVLMPEWSTGYARPEADYMSCSKILFKGVGNEHVVAGREYSAAYLDENVMKLIFSRDKGAAGTIQFAMGSAKKIRNAR